MTKVFVISIQEQPMSDPSKAPSHLMNTGGSRMRNSSRVMRRARLLSSLAEASSLAARSNTPFSNRESAVIQRDNRGNALWRNMA